MPMRDNTPPEVLEHNERQNREAERSWNAQSGLGRRTQQEVVVVEQVQRSPLPTGITSPLELAPAEFKRGLQVRVENRKVLVQWLKDALVRGSDFGRIHFKSKRDCPKGPDCTNEAHYTKDTLFKPGAQKICGMLGLTPIYPNLARYEEAALNGTPVNSIILRCQIVAADGRILAEGVGARSLQQDYGDLNKALKMASKSAHIDATLCLAGLSEIFSHPDQPPPPAGKAEEVDPLVVPCGRFEGQFWADMTPKYLEGVLASEKAPRSLKQGAKAELDRRPPPPDFDDDIPF